jgi:colanic acid/amylovoran biosynthesis glycosyltransferase
MFTDSVQLQSSNVLGVETSRWANNETKALRDLTPARRPQPSRARHTALIFRERLLASRESFIVEQAQPLRRYSPVLVGLRRTGPSLQHPLPELLLRNGDALLDRLAVDLYRRFPLSQEFVGRLRATEPSIIHAHFALDAVQALPIAKNLNLPLVVSLHWQDVDSSQSALRTSSAGRRFLAGRELLFKEAAAFICVSQFVRDAALEAGFPESKLHVHYTGIDCRRFRPASVQRDPKLILFVGGLADKKGCESLLRAMSLVQQLDQEAHLEVIGDGPMRARMESIAASLALPVSFRGAQSPDQVLESMLRARVLCNTSVTGSSGDMEGFGMVFLEAQAVGTPVVSFSHAAIPEVVNHGWTGLLCPENKTATLAHSLLTLLQDDALWMSMSYQAVEWVNRRFDICKQTQDLESIYDECVADHQNHHSEVSDQSNRIGTRQTIMRA